MMSRLIKIFILFVLLSPVTTDAQIIITEIMYNLEGTDSGFEWVEIYNEGSTSVDLSDWKLFENETNHRINSYFEGEIPILNSNSYAIIADNPDKFKQNNSGFGGLLLDSAFSLSNSGETLIIRNSELSDVDSVSYDPEMGANGDGNSLQLSEKSWISSAPTPGSGNNSFSQLPQEDSDADDPLNLTLSAEQELDLMKQNLIVDAGGNRKVVAGADTLFKAFAVGKKDIPLKNAHYSWSLGDGSKKEGQSVLYTYKYPGEYVVVLNVVSSDYSAQDRIIVEALPAEIIVSQIDVQKGFVELFNRSKYELDLSWWHLISNGQDFVFPKDTIILPNKKLKFSSSVTNLNLNDLSQVYLLYPNKEIVHHYEKDFAEEIVHSKTTKTPPLVQENSFQETPLEEEKFEPKEYQMASVSDFKEEETSGFNKWTFLLGGIMLFSVGGALVTGKIIGEEPENQESDLKPEDFTIIE